MRLLFATILSAILLFAWGFVYWTVVPYPNSVMRTLPDQEVLAKELLERVPESGVYLIPGGADAMANDPEFAKRHQAGPIATLIFRREGSPSPDYGIFVSGFVHMLVSSLFAGLVVLASGRRFFLGKFMVAFWMGLFAAIWTEGTRAIWFHFPQEYAVMYGIYHLSAAIILGIVMGAVLQPEPEVQI